MARAITAPGYQGVLSDHLTRGIVAFALFVFCVWLFDRSPPVALSDGFVVNRTVRPGDTLEVDWTQTWHKRCKGFTAREIVRADNKVDHYDKLTVDVPEKVGMRRAVASVELSKIMPVGPAKYRTVMTFPAQVSKSCLLMFPVTFTTKEVPFVVTH